MAYNFVAGQRLGQPVTALNRGRALRAAERRAGEEMEMAQHRDARADRAEQRYEAEEVRRQSVFEASQQPQRPSPEEQATFNQQQGERGKYRVNLWNSIEESYGPEMAQQVLQPIFEADRANVPDWAKPLITGDGVFDIKMAKTRLDAFNKSQPITEESVDQNERLKRELTTRYMAEGMSYQEARDKAVDRVDDNVSLEIVPETGNALRVDEIHGTVTEVPVESSESVVVRAKPEPEKTLYALAQYATGPVSAIAAGVSIPAAWAGLSVEGVAVSARQTMELHTTELIRALSINPRFPVGEITRIQEEVKLKPTFFDDPALMQLRMIAISDGMKLRAIQAERDGNDASLPRDLRESQKSNAVAINNFLDILGVPENLTATSDQLAEVRARAFDGFEDMSAEDQRRLIELEKSNANSR